MSIEEEILKIKRDQIKTLELVEGLADSLAKTIEAMKKFADVVTKEIDNAKRHGIIRQMKTKYLKPNDIVEDGDEYLENGQWYPCVAEDFNEPVSVSGYEKVRRLEPQ
jgi:hypothetical protein